MLLLFLLSLVASKNKFNLVKYGQLLVVDGVDPKTLEKTFENLKKHAKEYCSSDEAKTLDDGDDEYDDQYWIDYCVATIEAMNQVKAASPTDFNKVISEFNKVNEFLMILGTFKVDVDLSNVKHDMIVSVSYEENIEIDAKQLDENKYVKLIMKNARKVIKAKLDGSEKSIMRFALVNKKPKYSDWAFNLVGNVGSKVTFLICSGSHVTITKSELNAPRAIFAGSTIDSDSKMVKVGHFLADYDFMTECNSIIGDLFDVNQFGVVVSSYQNFPFRIQYSLDGWQVGYKQNNIYYLFADQYSNVLTVPYKCAPIFNLIVLTYEINIYLPSFVTMNSYGGINLTLVDGISTSPNGDAKKLQVNEIKITQEGFPENLKDEDKPKITLSYDKEQFTFEEKPDDYFKVSKEEVYSYKPANRKNVNVGMIVGIVVAVVVVIVVVVVVVIIVIRKKKNAQQSASENEGEDKA